MELEAVLSSPPPRLAAPRLATPLVSDERLAKLVSRGDETAFSVLYQRYHQPLYRYCRSLLRHHADAEDALQCAFVSALQSLRREQRDVPVRPWLFRIAHNQSISLIRRRRPEQQLTEGGEPHTASVEEQLEERHRLALLIADLQALPERQRAALLMRELTGLSHKEVALVLGISVEAAKQSTFEARRSLTAFTEGRAMNCEEVRRMISDADGRTLRSRRVCAHTRHCSDCRAFAAAIKDRSRRLQLLAPTLPPAAAAALARWIAGSMSGGDTAGIAAGGGKTLGAGVSLAIKATAITATTAVVAAGTSIELPHILAHQSGRDHAVPAVRLTREVRGHPTSGGRGLRIGRVAGSAKAAPGRAGSATSGQTARSRGHPDGGGHSRTPAAATGSAGQTGKPSSAPPSQAAQGSNGQAGNSDAQGTGGTSGGGQGSSGPDSGQGGNSDAQGRTNNAANGVPTSRPSSSVQPVHPTVAAAAGSSPPPATADAAADGNVQDGASSACGNSSPACAGSGNSAN